MTQTRLLFAGAIVFDLWNVMQPGPLAARLLSGGLAVCTGLAWGLGERVRRDNQRRSAAWQAERAWIEAQLQKLKP